MRKIFIIIMLFTVQLYAQTVYELPFASEGNQIELAVANTTGEAFLNVTVNVESKPAWIKFKNTQFNIPVVERANDIPALFEFSVDRRAPVGEEGKIVFVINDPSGDKTAKEINVAVSKPVSYQLAQNYPNPFNPSTKIEFIIPDDEKVTIKVYDILGREVKTVLNEFREAGHHEIEFNASQFASGTYIYRLTTGSFSQIKKMQLIK
ncbi:T9SS type A sorting domain-containing protein [Bacteroidota bacterium]